MRVGYREGMCRGDEVGVVRERVFLASQLSDSRLRRVIASMDVERAFDNLAHDVVEESLRQATFCRRTRRA